MRGDAVFVRGITPRSGTNFLWDLLRLHPALAAAREPIWEDNVLARSDLLRAYVGETAATWQEVDAPGREELEGELAARIGDALMTFLQTTPDKRLLTKTPHVHHLGDFLRLFPRAQLVILVRDGRAVVSSALGTFGGTFEGHARRWASAASAVSAFDRDNAANAARYRIVRYEDLVADVCGQMGSLLSFLGLDQSSYDFEAADRLPVRGSSVVGTDAAGRVHWDAVERPRGFDPTERFRTWPARRHARFNWIAGRQLEELGYEPVRVGRSLLRNVSLDAAWTLAQPVRPLRRRVAAIGGRLRPA